MLVLKRKRQERVKTNCPVHHSIAYSTNVYVYVYILANC